MKKLLLFVLFFALAAVQLQAQECKFSFVGTLAQQKITMCFYPDANDGSVRGHYFYGDGTKGNLNFTGTAVRQADGSYRQNLEERNAGGEVTGYFVGVLKSGLMTGTWTSTDGKRSYKYQMKMVKN